MVGHDEQTPHPGLLPRPGPRPRTTTTNPHTQLDQLAEASLQDRLRDHALGLPGVRRGRSTVSVPGAVAFFLDHPLRTPSVPLLWQAEWGHIHPHYDGSLHLILPTALAGQLIELGWAEYHTVVQRGLLPPVVIMLYGPRDEQELTVGQRIVEAAYLAAGGAEHDAAGRALDPRQRPGADTSHRPLRRPHDERQARR